MVQLASFEYMMEPLDFVPIRQMQARIAQTMPHVCLVCAMDAGLRYDIHPKNKKPVGERLALQALHRVYGLPLLSDSPSFREIRKQGCELVISFLAGEGLHVRGAEPQTVDLEVNRQSTVDFIAAVRDDCLVISSPELENARCAAVRFAWRPWCEDNVCNRADLPVFPFEATWQQE